MMNLGEYLHRCREMIKNSSYEERLALNILFGRTLGLVVNFMCQLDWAEGWPDSA